MPCCCCCSVSLGDSEGSSSWTSLDILKSVLLILGLVEKLFRERQGLLDRVVKGRERLLGSNENPWQSAGRAKSIKPSACRPLFFMVL